MANKPNNPSLWSRAKSLARQKFDVYPSAYANGWAAKWYKGKGGTWRKAQDGMEVMADGGTNNPGFQALPDYVQAKILANMGYGGYYNPIMADGGEPNGEMALGQMAAVEDKMRKLLQFVKPDDNLDPWIASKLAVMDHSADAIADYMMYGPEAEEGMGEMDEMKDGGGIPDRYKNKGFTKVGVKRQSNRPGKKWMVLAKKGDSYKVVHGGYKGMKDYTQHGSESRRENFWNRMGGKNSAKATDPFSPLYWHKRFGTWKDGGLIEYGVGDEVVTDLPKYDAEKGLRNILNPFNNSQFDPFKNSLYNPFTREWNTEQLLADGRKNLREQIKPLSGKDYNYITPALMNMGLSAVGGITQGISDNRNFRNDTSDSLFPTVANTYSRGRNEINTGRYADDSLVPVQFAGTPVSEYYGAPVYREMGGSFEVSSGILGLPSMVTDPSLYDRSQLSFTVPDFAMSTSAPLSPAANKAAVPGRDMSDYRNYIKMRESRGDYSAESPNSSATGAYQFIWSLHNSWIKDLTGVKSKKEFLNNPKAQELAFDYWDKNTLTPTAQKIKRSTGTTDSLEQIKMKVHFAGPRGAMRFYTTGEETVDANGTKTSNYSEGGEYDLDPAQIQQILENGGQIEYL